MVIKTVVYTVKNKNNFSQDSRYRKVRVPLRNSGIDGLGILLFRGGLVYGYCNTRGEV